MKFHDCSGKRPQQYCREDICKAAILKSISPKSFNFIRKKGLLQLPCKSTVNMWLTEFQLEEGFQWILLNVVKKSYKEPQAMETFISFDEMALKSRWVYDKVILYSKVYGPPSCVEIIEYIPLYIHFRPSVRYIHQQRNC